MVVDTIGGYEIREELGRGGMGVVYRGFDAKLEREVAIKVVENMTDNSDSLTQTTHQELVERFKTEAKAIAKLSHPNIVNIFDFGVDHGRNYMVMELLKGRDLSQILRFNSPLSVELVVKSVIPVCEALDFAHQNGIIHRDIKPANIILLDSGVAKLMDFGIARIQESQSQLTQAGTILGSVLYISPEQLISAQKVDKRADIYSLGVTMYELLTGKFPYDGDNVASIITKIMNKEPDPPSSFNPKIPPELDDIILKAIEKNPEHRFQRAMELGEALKDFLYKIKGGSGDPAMGATSAGGSYTSSGLSRTSVRKTLEITLVEGIDQLNLYSLVYRIIQTWQVENIGNKPLLEAIFKNENLSQAIVVSDRVILLVYKGLLIGAVSNEPDAVGSTAYEATADIVKVDIKSCIPSETQQDFLVVIASILGSGRLLSKHPSANSNDLENYQEKIKEEGLTGHMEVMTSTETRYRGFVDGSEVFNLIFPGKNKTESSKRMDLEIYEARLKLFGPSLRRAIIDATMAVINKKHGSAATFKQLTLQKLNNLIPEMVEEAVRNTDIAVFTSVDKVYGIGKNSIKYTEIIQDFSAVSLVRWIIKNLLLKIAKAPNFKSLKSAFNWIWSLETVKLSQSLKMEDGKTVNFDMVAYNNLEKISVLSRYSSQGSVSELQSFIDSVNQIKKGIPNSEIKAAVYISGNDYFPEVLKYYEKIVGRQSFFAFGSPKCFVKGSGFVLLLVKETIDGFKLVQPNI